MGSGGARGKTKLKMLIWNLSKNAGYMGLELKMEVKEEVVIGNREVFKYVTR